MCLCVCVRECVRACVRACLSVCLSACPFSNWVFRTLHGLARVDRFVGDSTPAILAAVVLFILPSRPPRWMACCRSKATAISEYLYQTPSTSLRHPSFGGRCRKAMLGVCVCVCVCVCLCVSVCVCCLLYTSPSPRDLFISRMPSSA